jgi:nucleotide-binding universal stress UspA family protein
MNFKRIMVALAVRGDEDSVIRHAVEIAKKYGGKLIALHVNPPHAGEMSMMMDSIGPKIEEEDVRKEFVECGFENELKRIEIKIVSGESIPLSIADNTGDIDLLILGHRRMSTFKANFLDSVDEGIVNKVNCPVLVVPKE